MMLKDIDYPGPSFDASAALAAALAAAGIDPARSAAALVVATRDGPARAGHRDAVDFYPASVAKLPLLAAADEISRLLDLPLKVTGDSVEGSPEVCRALEELERYKQMVKAAA